MKLYVWNSPYHVSYGSSLVFAVAVDLESAREQASKGNAYAYGDCPKGNPNVALGEPTRVVDLPCAEWHEWSE